MIAWLYRAKAVRSCGLRPGLSGDAEMEVPCLTRDSARAAAVPVSALQRPPPLRDALYRRCSAEAAHSSSMRGDALSELWKIFDRGLTLIYKPHITVSLGRPRLWNTSTLLAIDLLQLRKL